MGLFLSLAMSIRGMGALPLLILAGLGSAAFHPAGAKEATLRGQTHFNGREITAASYFFFFGQSALFFGPIIGGPLLDHFGTHGLLILPVFTLPLSLYVNRQLRNRSTPPQSYKNGTTGEEINRPDRILIFALALVAALQAWSQQNMITFLPKYLLDLGQTATIYGMVSALFMGGSALENVGGGYLADVFGKRSVAMTALALASLPLFTISKVSWSSWLYLLVPLAGALTGSVNSILVVTAQRSIPGGMALASGLIYGFMFSAGALGTMLSGSLADAWGFPPVFQMTGILTLIAAGFSLFLTRTPRSLISR
jgi:FSR family fosmidomycin resistance protein-like MFS transporter